MVKLSHKFYWAYGSNLNVDQMRYRCPRASMVRPLVVHDAQLVFRMVADVVKNRGSSVQGGLWWITDACEAVLDRYEGVSGGLYSKRYFHITGKDGAKRPVLWYQMNRSGVMPPSEYYLDSIVQGYRDFGLDLSCLEEAVERSYGEKRKTKHLRQRYRDKGKPPLARREYFQEEDHGS